MIIVTRRNDYVAVTQASHASMCEELAHAWGNESFGQIEQSEDVRVAAEQHELGWLEWDQSPTLDPSTGLPFTVRALDPAVHLPMQLEGPRKLASQNPYAGLLVLLKHMSMYAQPSLPGLLRADRRRLRSHLNRSAALQAELRAVLVARDPEVEPEIERNWRLVRTWDALSHDLLLDRAPCIRQAVPAAGNATVDLQLGRRDGVHTLDPWPYSRDSVRVHARGRVLEKTFSDQDRMRAALTDAPEVTLTYELAPA